MSCPGIVRSLQTPPQIQASSSRKTMPALRIYAPSKAMVNKEKKGSEMGLQRGRFPGGAVTKNRAQTRMPLAVVREQEHGVAEKRQ